MTVIVNGEKGRGAKVNRDNNHDNNSNNNSSNNDGCVVVEFDSGAGCASAVCCTVSSWCAASATNHVEQADDNRRAAA